MKQDDITLISINWNQKRAMEIMLKSYCCYHNAEKLNLILVDNGSKDGSKEWLIENKIPFVSLPENIGHEEAVDYIYPLIKTKYALIVDTDIIFTTNIVRAYDSVFSEEIKLVGDYITQHTPPLVPRIAAWFFFYDIEAMRNKGINVFRGTSDSLYDVGSWQTQKVIECGFKFFHTQRKNPQPEENTELIGMIYDTHIHLGKLSWDLNVYQDRTEEVMKRRDYLRSYNQYDNIELLNRFK